MGENLQPVGGKTRAVKADSIYKISQDAQDSSCKSWKILSILLSSACLSCAL